MRALAIVALAVVVVAIAVVIAAGQQFFNCFSLHALLSFIFAIFLSFQWPLAAQYIASGPLCLFLCFGPLGWPDCLTAQPTEQTHLPPPSPFFILAGLIAVMCYMRAWMKCRSNERDRKKKHTKKQLQRRCSVASTSTPAALAVKKWVHLPKKCNCIYETLCVCVSVCV